VEVGGSPVVIMMPVMMKVMGIMTMVVILSAQYPGRYAVDDQTDAGHRHGGSFCPPGQAKKGRC